MHTRLKKQRLSENDLINKNKSKTPNALDLSTTSSPISNDDMIDVIIPYLEKNPLITMLKLRGNYSIEKGIIALTQAKTNITHLNLSCCNITDPAVFQSLCCGAYIYLCLDGNSIADKDLAMVIKKNPKLKVLSIRYISGDERVKQCYPDAVKAIAESVIEEIDFSCQQIRDNDMEYLSKSETIKKLDVSDSLITDVGVRYLATNAINKVITDLNLSINDKITDDALCELITKNNTLNKINLDYISNIGDKTAFALARHNTLKEAGLYQNNAYHITKQGMKALYAKYDTIWFSPNIDQTWQAIRNEDDPHKRTYLSEDEVKELGTDPNNVKDIFSQVPTLFRLAAYQAKCHYLNQIYINREYKLCLMTDELFKRFGDHEINKNCLGLTHKTIYIYSQAPFCGTTAFAVKMIGMDNEIKRTDLYSHHLPDWFPKKTDEVIAKQDKCMPFILKHLHNEGIINIIPENANITDAAREVIQKKKV